MDSNSFLDRLSIASPCHADWNEMKGDERTRFCGLCQLNVYNLSGISREEAEQLVQAQEGRLCVRFYRRQDGTVITADCPVGLQARYKRRIRLGKVAAAVTLITAVGVFTTSSYAQPGQSQVTPNVMGQMVMGDVALPTTHPGVPMMGGITPPPAQQPDQETSEEDAEPPSTNTQPSPQSQHPLENGVVMGRIKLD